MSHKDDDQLAWRGSPRIRRSGGFVDGVAVNEPTHSLAVDPNGVAGPAPERASGPGGPKLSVDRLDDSSDGPVQRNGRVRLTRY